MRAALLLALVGCGRIGFDVPGGDGGVDPTGDGSLGTGDAPAGSSITYVGSNGTTGTTNPITTLPGVMAGDLVIMAVGYSGATATITAMEADGDLAMQVVSQTFANQIHIGMFSVRIAADHATETFGAVINPMPAEASLAVALYRGASGIQGSTSAESSGSTTAKYTLFGVGGDLAVSGLAAGAADTGASPGFVGVASVPGNLVKRLIIGNDPIPSTGLFSATETLASATDWAMGALAIAP